MSTRRATRARVQTQQNSPPPTQHNTSADDEGDVSPCVLHNLTKEVSDIKAQMAAMQANLHFISEQLRNPSHIHRASPRETCLSCYPQLPRSCLKLVDNPCPPKAKKGLPKIEYWFYLK